MIRQRDAKDLFLIAEEPDRNLTAPSTLSTPNGSRSDARKIPSGVFKTPALPPPEEIKVLRLWEMLLDLFEYEAEETLSCNDDGQRMFETGSPALSSYVRNKDATALPRNTPGPKRVYQPRLVHDACWAMLKDDHPDEILARFLQQSGWDVERAFDRFIMVLKRRSKELGIDALMTSGEEGMFLTAATSTNAYEKQVAEGFCGFLRSGMTYARGMDKQGRPIAITRCVLNRASVQPAESTKKMIMWTCETLRLVMPPSVDTFTAIYDLAGFGIAHCDLSVTRFLSDVFENLYPEGVSLVIIHRAPRLFESIWSIFKTLMSERRIEKVRFTYTVEDLEQYIARDNIPKFMGGDDHWEYSYPMPEPDENIAQTRKAACQELVHERQLTTVDFEQITRELIFATREGAFNTPEIKMRRGKCVDRLRIQFWRLDPLVRARSFYDRWGVVRLRRKAALDAFRDEDISNRFLGVV